MKISGDVDIDFADRAAALQLLEHVPASVIKNNKIEKHNTGVYFHVVPTDPVTQQCSLSYENAEIKNCFKIDLLNVYVYKLVKDEEHLISLMNKDFDFTLLHYPEFSSQLVHLSNHTDLISKLKPMNLNHVAMILALIRPAKKHLIRSAIENGLDSIEPEIWKESDEGLFSFKKSHSIGYAMLIKVHANLLLENLN